MDDKKEGYGRLSLPDGRIYEGYWKNGAQHGEGNYKNKNGDWKEGVWENGKNIK